MQYENVGPISHMRIQMPFSEHGSPKPVVLVGENGSGKSTVLSNIVDAFYEMAGMAFDNVRINLSGSAYQYYKIVGPGQIKTGQSYMYTYISFDDEKEHYYLCKSGTISDDELVQKIGLKENTGWRDTGNEKKITATKEEIEKSWQTNVICYFAPDRYERPSWMGEKYYDLNNYMHPTIKERFSGHLDKPISVKNATADNLQWLLDVIADSRTDIRHTGNKLEIEHVLIKDLLLLRQARTNIENVLSKILGEEVYFSLNFRNAGGSRFGIKRKKDESIVCPSLDSLSTGQIALFNMFATIIRYADYNDINKSFHLSDIKGIVVIDEIELHLHTTLQKEILPALMSMFPGIQFIVTTHAPLFLLGMRDAYGEDGFRVIELPAGESIDTERFTEFRRAYDYLKETNKYKDDVLSVLTSYRPKKKTVLITEGSTDWKHIKAAHSALAEKNEFSFLKDLDYELYEYEPMDCSDQTRTRLQMSNSELVTLCKSFAKLPHEAKYIFLADRDDEKTNKELGSEDTIYRSWGNNVYSFVLPIPENRKHTPKICIEHLYTDDEIKTEWIDKESGIKRRLYMGYEFDKRGIAAPIGMFCENRNRCGRNSIAIIDGSNGEKVTSIVNDQINYALPKSRFAELVLSKTPPFDVFDFSGFAEIFTTIQQIVREQDEK